MVGIGFARAQKQTAPGLTSRKAAQEGPGSSWDREHAARACNSKYPCPQGAHMGRRLRMAIMGSLAAAALVAFGSIGAAASHGGGGSSAGGGHSGGTSSGSCSLSPATLGAALTINGRGFTPGASYTLDVTWPYGGSGFLFATADSLGNWGSGNGNSAMTIHVFSVAP